MIERLTTEILELKADVMRRNGGRPIRLSPQQHQRLNQLRKGIDPDVLREIDLLADSEYGRRNCEFNFTQIQSRMSYFAIRGFEAVPLANSGFRARCI